MAMLFLIFGLLYDKYTKEANPVGLTCFSFIYREVHYYSDGQQIAQERISARPLPLAVGGA